MKKTKNTILSALLLFITIGVWGQLENANWYFGKHAGLNFESGVVALTDGENDTIYRASTTVSDGDGNLLFYSIGNDVWNRNHELMPNCGSSIFAETQVIMPYPGDANKYYIFSANDTDGYFYSIVNMSLNGGLGDVEVYNVTLSSIPNPSNWKYAEQMLVTKHSDNESYWLIIQPGTLNEEYFAIRVDDSGISNTPIISEFNCKGYPVTPISISASGSLISSIELQGVLGGGSEDYFLSILNFDNTTGLISCFIDENGQSIGVGNKPEGWIESDNYLSVEFSKNSRFVYVLQKGDASNKFIIIQYDLDNISTNTALETASVLSSVVDIEKATLRRAINNKIYVTSLNGSEYISVINNPNALGSANNFTENQIDLLGNKGKKLPYLVPESFCFSTLTITEDVFAGGTNYRSAGNTITASNTIFNDAIAEYDAGNIIYLKPNFHAKYGSNFVAFIEGCNDAPKKNITNSKRFVNNTTKSVNLYPNPTKNTVFVESTNAVESFVLSNSYGKIYYNALASNPNKITIDMSNIPLGIYFLKITFKYGDIMTKTIIKE